MKHRLTNVLVLLGLFFFQARVFSQTPNYTGTWVLNLQKSQLESRPEGLTGSIFIIKQEGDKFSLTRYHIIGDKRKKISFKMFSDGKTRRVKILFKGKLQWDSTTLQATLWRKNFSNIVHYKFGASRDEFIADEVFKGNPKNHHNIWVFDREIKK
jgi:hypothetical protein